MYMRFVVTQIDSMSHREKGLFVASQELLEDGNLTSHEREQLEEVLEWFDEHLLGPGDWFNSSRAIFWFKRSAMEHINQMWRLANLLRLHGLYIEVQRCTRLANVVFEDDYQVVAYPSRHDGRCIYA